MSKHTPGPWFIRQGDEWTNDVVTLEGGNAEGTPMYWNVATVNNHRDEVKANARLIAAVPDLLEDLKGVLRVADRATVEFDVARAAIAKATGEKQ